MTDPITAYQEAIEKLEATQQEVERIREQIFMGSQVIT